MGLFSRWKENRADEIEGATSFEDPLLKALLGGDGMDKEKALQVPTVAGGVDLIAGIIAGTPIKLYREHDGKTEEVRDDVRVRLLNDETGDTLDANQFWRAMVRDYYTGKGGYAYIHREGNTIRSLHYVDEAQISIIRNNHPIFKDFDIMVQGERYRPYDFLKVLRNSTDGAEGIPITKESSRLLEVAYQTMVFESNQLRKGGNKRGFLKSQKRLTEEAMTALKEAYRRLYSNNSDGENVVVLNDGLDFKESSATMVEMQLNERKISNADEFAKIFHISPEMMEGGAPERNSASLAKLAVVPLMNTIQCALNRDFLLEREKGEYYWAFDAKELLRESLLNRYRAYKIALDGNFLRTDEVRYMEDMEPLGINWIRLGLQDVLYNPQTKEIYTPNTNQTTRMGEKSLTGRAADSHPHT